MEKPTCSICGKSFPSHKSLYGHMRCHPDRYYRGMQPPDAFEFATGDLDSVMEKGAVYALMLMATGDERYRHLDNDKIEDEDKAQKSSISNKKPRLVVHGSTSDDSDRKRETAKVKDSELSDQEINNPADAFVSLQPPPPPPPAPATTVSKVGHMCKICDKAFPSAQALGAHTRRHWRVSALPLSAFSLASIPGQVQLPMMRSDGPDHSGLSTATAEITRPVVDFDLNQFPDGDTEEQARMNPNE